MVKHTVTGKWNHAARYRKVSQDITGEEVAGGFAVGDVFARTFTNVNLLFPNLVNLNIA